MDIALTVMVIQRHVTDSWNAGPPTFMAVTTDEKTALAWIQDEVDGKHETSHLYAKGHDASWWVNYGTFSIRETPLYGFR